MDMSKDLFAQQPYGKIALAKLAPVPANFRLYQAGWLGDKPGDWEVMKITGAEFRVAKTGKNAGKLSILVKGSVRSTYVTRAEMDA